jgi:imidazolonepropionase
MLDAGLPLAIASDYNPGSSPTGNMPLMISLACIGMKLTPEEAFNAVTINTAAALELSHTHGSITEGKVANVFITQPMPSVAYFPYAFGSQLVETVIIGGKVC